MTSRWRFHWLGALAAALVAAPAVAAPILATSYDMPNGDGVAHSGSFNYWDRDYSGTGMTTVDGAPLSGGLGDLTDGVVAADFWFNTENSAGTGPYVGWRGDVGTSNPVIVFAFAGAPTIDRISIHLDNSQAGGVGTPAAILVDGVAQSFTGPAPGTIGTVDLTGLMLTGGSHTIQFVQDSTFVWTFASEISFFGRTQVPAPASGALLLGALALVACVRPRRKAPA